MPLRSALSLPLRRPVRRRWRTSVAAFAILPPVLCLFPSRGSNAADRVALVIGNGAYQNATRLANPVRDAEAVSLALRASGFESIEVRDAGVEAFFEALERFKAAATEAQVALFFFAGHGLEVDGKNYLLPVDAVLENSAQLRTQSVALETVLGDLDAARVTAKLVILDCCRDNPLARSWMASRSSGKGGGLGELADSAVPPATMIMYASAPGQVALDGTGANSPFTEALVNQLTRRGVSAFDAFLGVSDAVAQATGEKQVPWIKFDGAGRAFRLFTLGGDGAVVTPAVAMRPPPVPPNGPAPTPEQSPGRPVPMVAMRPQAVSPRDPSPSIGPAMDAGGLVGTQPGALRTIGGIEMAWCPPGQFLMGSPEAEEGRKFGEENQVHIRLTQGFWLARTECTQGQWKALMGTSVAQQRAKGAVLGNVIAEGEDLPVYFVSWEEVLACIDALNRTVPAPAGWSWALPTEAQWEYACRAGTAGPYSGDLNRSAWYVENSGGKMQPVGTKEANPWGLFDLHGNVQEWCRDWAGGREDGTDPAGLPDGVNRVFRGGSYESWPAGCRSAFPGYAEPGHRSPVLGFRPALVPSEAGSGTGGMF